MSTEAGDVYARIGELETELRGVESMLEKLRVRVPASGCGDSTHTGLAAKVASQETLLARTTRGRRTTARLAVGRGDRLDTEIARVKKELLRVEPLARSGDRALLQRLRAAQQRRRVLELQSQAPITTAIVPSSRLSLAEIERSPGRSRAASWFAWVAGTLTTLFLAGASTPLAIGLLATLVASIALADFAFPGARRDLVTAHTIYGERWKRVRSIEFRTDGTLLVETLRRTHRFDENMIGYFDVVRLVLAAAAEHGISVRGSPPDILALATPSGLSSGR